MDLRRSAVILALQLQIISRLIFQIPGKLVNQPFWREFYKIQRDLRRNDILLLYYYQHSNPILLNVSLIIVRLSILSIINCKLLIAHVFYSHAQTIIVLIVISIHSLEIIFYQLHCLELQQNLIYTCCLIISINRSTMLSADFFRFSVHKALLPITGHFSSISIIMQYMLHFGLIELIHTLRKAAVRRRRLHLGVSSNLRKKLEDLQLCCAILKILRFSFA